MEDFANQSEPEVIETESHETPIETGGESQEPVTTQEEYDIIKYNKEEVKIPVSERQNYLQKGYNYDKVQQRAQELEQRSKDLEARTAYLEKRARQEGFNDVESYLKAIDDLERQQQYEREAARMGIDTDVYGQYFAPVNQELSQLKQELNTYKQQLTEKQQQEQRESMWGELYNSYPGLVESSQAFREGKTPEWFTKDMQELVSMGYKPIHAYELAHKNTLFQQKEQEALARVLGRDQKQVLPSKDSPNNVQFDPANMSFDEIQKISERVRRGERITF